MTKPEPGADFAPSRRTFGMRELWRVAAWGLSATAALTLAVFAASTEIGRDRLHVAFADIHESLIPSGAKPIRPLDAREGRRLAETVRMLAADRERLLDRVATLEQSIDGITGSIARVENAVKALPDAVPAPDRPDPPPSPTEEDVTSSVNPPADLPQQTMPTPPPMATSNAAKTEFGLDLGNAGTVEALRTAWTVALRRHGTLLQGLRPVVQTRERARAGGTELRLIAGPLPNAATAKIGRAHV